MEPDWMKAAHAEDVAKASLEQYEREKHMMPSGKAVGGLAPAGPTIRDVFLDEQRRTHAALLAECRGYLAAGCHDHATAVDLVRRLADALEGK